MAGTYIIRAGTVTLNNGGANQWTDFNGNPTHLSSDPRSALAGGNTAGGIGGPGDWSGFWTSTPGPNDASLRFAGDSDAIFLDNTLTPVAQADLPAGFTPTGATASIRLTGIGTYYIQFAAGVEDAGHVSVVGSPTRQDFHFVYPSTIPTIATLLADGFGVRKVIVGSEGPTNLIYAEIEGTYDIIVSSDTWWYNPTSDQFVFAAESPGEPFVASAAPTPTITAVDPRSI